MELIVWHVVWSFASLSGEVAPKGTEGLGGAVQTLQIDFAVALVKRARSRAVEQAPF